MTGEGEGEQTLVDGSDPLWFRSPLDQIPSGSDPLWFRSPLVDGSDPLWFRSPLVQIPSGCWFISQQVAGSDPRPEEKRVQL